MTPDELRIRSNPKTLREEVELLVEMLGNDTDTAKRHEEESTGLEFFRWEGRRNTVERIHRALKSILDRTKE